ncbi:MAG: hypothetical protein RLZZ360_6 [Candidatus Parcubacteria bacterium]|jgi:mRNA interferase RelE/StbE
MYNILLTKVAEKELFNLDKKIKERIVQSLEELSQLGTSASNIKKLQTPFQGFRKRVEDYRILFEVNEEIIIVYRIDKRSEVYR